MSDAVSSDTRRRCPVQAFVPRLLGRCRVNAYVTGNLGTAAAADLARHVQALLTQQAHTQPPSSSQVEIHWANVGVVC